MGKKPLNAESVNTNGKRKTGLGVTHYSWEEVMNDIRFHFTKLTPAQVITLTPEMAVRSWDDGNFRRIIDEAKIVVADGVGVQWGESKITGRKTSKIPGVELSERALDELNKISGKLYLLGGKPEVVREASERLSIRFPRITVSGFRDGYFHESEEGEIVKKIAETGPHLLLVGMGSPKQEIFISSHLKDLNCAVAIGCGGSIDIISGYIKRAPAFFRKTGTEWFWRILSQPGERIKRLPVLWRFFIAVLLNKFPIRRD
ncbi:MAG: WecB/TagA/CpsF family glycosyltransferase [bacterium]